jgi:hypothetical protein
VIRSIARDFDWTKFLPVIVVADGEHFMIVDGQHRTTAAASIGICEVPCYELNCTPAQAAGAFVAINSNVTPVRPVDIWFAQLFAQDPDALALDAVLRRALVTVSRKKDDFDVGETASINVLKRAHKTYGADLLGLILQCITQTGEGNRGLIVGAVVHGIGRAIKSKADLLADPMTLFEIFDDIPLGEILHGAKVEAAERGHSVQTIISREINARLRQHGRQAA